MGPLHREISGDVYRPQDYILTTRNLIAANLFAANP